MAGVAIGLHTALSASIAAKQSGTIAETVADTTIESLPISQEGTYVNAAIPFFEYSIYQGAIYYTKPAIPYFGLLVNQVLDWIKTFGNQDDLAEVMEYLDGLYVKIKTQIEQEMQKQSKKGSKTDGEINATVIAHGGIRQPFVQSLVHYFCDFVKSVTFYQPWGCMLHSTAAYGIATNHISMDNRHFFPPMDAAPTHWNRIPNDSIKIPLVYFSPILDTEQVCQDLILIDQHFRHDGDGIVFEYVSGPGAEKLPQFLPLPLLCTIFGMAAGVFGATVNVRVASCLDWDDDKSHALMTQYCSVPKHTTTMYSNLGHAS